MLNSEKGLLQIKGPGTDRQEMIIGQAELHVFLSAEVLPCVFTDLKREVRVLTASEVSMLPELEASEERILVLKEGLGLWRALAYRAVVLAQFERLLCKGQTILLLTNDAEEADLPGAFLHLREGGRWTEAELAGEVLRDRLRLQACNLIRPRFYQALDLLAAQGQTYLPQPEIGASVEYFAALLDHELETSLEQHGRPLRRGYTSGSTATAAARAAAGFLLEPEAEYLEEGGDAKRVRILLPRRDQVQSELLLPLTEICFPEKNCCQVAVRKDAGDDPDVTDGLLIWAEVRALPEEQGFVLEAGEGIGRVTLPGLQIAVGEAAINPVPRQMLQENLKPIQARHHCGLHVKLWIPEGASLAKRTFNPRLGIVGGLSILGTTGIVEPMSESALRMSMERELHLLDEAGLETCYLCLGNMGEKLLRSNYAEAQALPLLPQIGNEIGFILAAVHRLHFRKVVLVGALGKLIKVAAGIFQTHSHVADARAELAVAFASLIGCPSPLLAELYEQISTDRVLQILEREGYQEAFLHLIARKICERIRLEFQSELSLEILLSNGRGELIYQYEDVH